MKKQENETFNFDLERIKKSVESEDINAPYFETDEQFLEWVEGDSEYHSDSI